MSPQTIQDEDINKRFDYFFDEIKILLFPYLKKSLPQDWLINISNHTNCEETDTFIRIDSQPNPNNKRDLICLIGIKQDEIIIRTPNVQSAMIEKVTEVIRPYCLTSNGFCLTLTECPLNCECCRNAWQKYHE